MTRGEGGGGQGSLLRREGRALGRGRGRGLRKPQPEPGALSRQSPRARENRRQSLAVRRSARDSRGPAPWSDAAAGGGETPGARPASALRVSLLSDPPRDGRKSEKFGPMIYTQKIYIPSIALYIYAYIYIGKVVISFGEATKVAACGGSEEIPQEGLVDTWAPTSGAHPHPLG